MSADAEALAANAEAEAPVVNAVVFDDVSYGYDGRTLALDGVTLAIEPGSFVCVLGGNGSGKSTLARHVDALLLPDAGEVWVDGLRTSEAANLFEVRRSAGLVFQNPDDQIVGAVVEDDVAFGPENLGVPSADLPRRVDAALERVGLQGFDKRETLALSGGQKQRVAIAGALAMHPKILVLDEASAMLDPRGRAGLMRLCRKLHESGMTIVLITHFMEEAAQSDRVVVLDAGAVAMDGTPDEVLVQARRLRELALEVPFATRMSLALQDVGVPVRTCIAEDDLERQLQGLPCMRNGACMAAVCGTAGDKVADRADGRDACAAADSDERLTPATQAPVVVFEGVSYSYAPKRMRRQWAHAKDQDADDAPKAAWGAAAEDPWALRDVSFALREGDFLGIAGHTGSGKSTLLQVMAGLLQPTGGAVFVQGRNLADKHALREVRGSVGLVFQYPERQLFAPTVFEDVAFGPRNLGLSHDEVAERVRASLALVHLDADEVGGKSPFELSGGQQRRVAMAGVLAMRPRVLILDEPTAGLDPRAHGRFLDLIAELHETGNVATVMVSHNMDDLARLCSRVMLLNRGRVVADGVPARIFSDEEAIRRIGLGVPHTAHLAQALGLQACFDGIPTISELAAQVAACYGSVLEGGAGER